MPNRRRLTRRPRPERRLGGSAVTTTAVGPTLRQRWRTIRWVLLTLAALTAISAGEHVPDRTTSRRSHGSRGDLAGRALTPWWRCCATTESRWSRQPDVDDVVAGDATRCPAARRPDVLPRRRRRAATAGRPAGRPTARRTGVTHPGGTGAGGPRGRQRAASAASPDATCAKPTAQATSSWASATPTRRRATSR